MGAPSWEELLAVLADKASNIDKGLVFYKQLLKDPIKIGEEFARLYQEWAWGAGHNEFPEEMFGENVGAQLYIKYMIAAHLRSLKPAAIGGLTPRHKLRSNPWRVSDRTQSSPRTMTKCWK